MEPALELWRRRARDPSARGWEACALRAIVEESADRKLPVADETHILIPTGGTNGAPKYAVHTWSTLEAAAKGLQAWLGDGPIHSVCFLPLHHVSGLMQIVRSHVSGGELTVCEWRDIESGRIPDVPPESGVTSLVPTQLARLLVQPAAVDWLRRFRAVFLGGAPAWPDLLERARGAQVPLAPCYGTTETAAQVTALSPEEFLAGRTGAGRALPHASIAVVDGRIRVRAQSLFLGYHPLSGPPPGEFSTSDIGSLAPDGNLTVHGRADGQINTGGEKVDPLEVEAAVRASGLVEDVAVIGLPDREWGEKVAAVVSPATVDVEAITARIRALLPSHAIPKRWAAVDALPRNAAGKIDRAALRAIVDEQR